MVMNFDNEFDPYEAISTPVYQTATFKQVGRPTSRGLMFDINTGVCECLELCALLSLCSLQQQKMAPMITLEVEIPHGMLCKGLIPVDECSQCTLTNLIQLRCACYYEFLSYSVNFFVFVFLAF